MMAPYQFSCFLLQVKECSNWLIIIISKGRKGNKRVFTFTMSRLSKLLIKILPESLRKSESLHNRVVGQYWKIIWHDQQRFAHAANV